MGLLDSVLGSVLNSGQQQAGATSGGLGGLIGMLASNPQLIQAITGILANDGEHGGLGGLVSKFQNAGLGDAINSWIGGGPNQAVSGEEVAGALGPSTVADIAAKMGMDPGDAAEQLSKILPNVINQLTPSGEAPVSGLGNGTDLMGMLGSLFKPA